MVRAQRGPREANPEQVSSGTDGEELGTINKLRQALCEVDWYDGLDG